jgi:hypothetical protein
MIIEICPRDNREFPSIFLRALKALEEKVAANENDGIIARWEFGKKILALREGKKLPRGMLPALSTKTGVGQREIQRRVRLASHFSDKAQLCHAVSQFPTWHQMVAKGLAGIQPGAISAYDRPL